MACNNICRLCDNLVISTAVTFTAGTGLIITVPEGSYLNNHPYCIVVAQSIPAATTITAPVYVQIGTGTELYPLTRRDCAQVTACGIKTRTRYKTVVVTTSDGGSFKLCGSVCCCNNNLPAITGDAPTA